MNIEIEKDELTLITDLLDHRIRFHLQLIDIYGRNIDGANEKTSERDLKTLKKAMDREHIKLDKCRKLMIKLSALDGDGE